MLKLGWRIVLMLSIRFRLKQRPKQAMQAVDRMLDTAMLGAAQARLDLDKAMNAKPGRKPRKAASVSRAASPRAKQGQGAAKTG